MHGKRAFTIVELMIVMIIIAVVIAILIPALGYARDGARDASTQGLMNNIVTAASKFEQDNRRRPGYFSAQDMGHDQNETRGMSTMENVLIEIAGGAVDAAPATQPPGTIIVNPTTDTTKNAYVDTKRIGLTGAYFVPPKNYLRAQTNDGQQEGEAGHTDAEGVDQMPDVIDAHGSPLLVWSEDEVATALPVAPNASPSRTLTKHHFLPNTQPARFYWASNAAFLQATAMGKKGRDQNFSNPDIKYSLIGGNQTDEAMVEEYLEAFLGNPNFPWVDPGNPNGAPQYASAPRSPFIVHSAGRDGYYFGSKDKGAKLISPYPLAGDRAFTAHFMLPGGNWPADRWKDKNDNVTTDDILRDFDDLIVTASN